MNRASSSLGILWEELRVTGIVWRAGICLAGYVVAFLVTLFPIPLVTDASVTQTVIRLLVLPWPGTLGCDFCQNHGGVFIYFGVAAYWAVVLMQPVLIYQVLALVCPSADWKRRLLVTFATTVSFAIGMVLGYALALPVAVHYLHFAFAVDFSPTSTWPLIDLAWHLVLYLATASMLQVYLGSAFQLPAWLAGLAWLGMLTRPRLAS